MRFRIFKSVLRKCIQRGFLTISYENNEYSFGDPTDPVKAKIIIHHPRFFARIMADGEIGLGESYVAKEWDSPSINTFLVLLMMNYKNILSSNLIRFSNFYKSLRYFLFGRPLSFTQDGTKKAMAQAYNVGNDFFRHMLGESFVYTCAIFKNRDQTLEQAQQNKIDVVLKKLRPEPGHKVLDIGCGWGSLLKEIHEKHGCEVTGVALAKEQIKYCQDTHPFGKFEYLDYRDLKEENYYDRVCSIGMPEHVGKEHLQAYINKVAQVLKPNGRAVLHTMIKGSASAKGIIPNAKGWSFSDKWIMPCTELSYDYQLIDAIHATGKLRILHQERIGMHYSETMRRWGKNVLDNADEITKNYPKDIIRAYEYMWAMCSSTFGTGIFDVWQVVIEKSSPTVDAPIDYPHDLSAKLPQKGKSRKKDQETTSVAG